MDELPKGTEPIDTGTWLMEPKRIGLIVLSGGDDWYRWAEFPPAGVMPALGVVAKEFRAKVHVLEKEELVTDRAGMFVARRRWQMKVIFKHPDVEQAWVTMERELQEAQEARHALRRRLVEAGFWKRLRYLFTKVLA